MSSAVNTRNKFSRHVHERRTYFGESVAQALLEWLNSNARKESDPVEKIILANAALVEKRDQFAAAQEIRSIINSVQLRLIPTWSLPLVESPSTGRKRLKIRGKATKNIPGRPVSKTDLVIDRSRWALNWDPVAKGMHRAQSLALYNLFQLAEQRLLDRVRKCARPDCGQWFFARFKHQRFHSEKCQLLVFRSDEQWKEHRRDYMRRLRRDEKFRG
jgi:hypothetical protein